MEDLFIPEELRGFIKEVVAVLDDPSSTKALDAEDAFRHEVGFGGRTGTEEGEDVFEITYLTKDRKTKWELRLKESALRDISDGLLVEHPGRRVDLDRSTGAPRKASGAGLLVWGEFGDDALQIGSVEVLEQALDGLHTAALERPRLLRLWSPTDDQAVAVIERDECALYIVESVEGYATSVGEVAGGLTTDVLDHDGRVLQVPSQDRLSWALARMGLLMFYEHGDLGASIKVEGSIPSGLMMMGDADRKAVLAARPEPPRELARSSVPRLAQAAMAAVDFGGAPRTDAGAASLSHKDGIFIDTDTMPAIKRYTPPSAPEALTAWGQRLLAALEEREFVVFGRANRDEVAYEVGNLLGTHAGEAAQNMDTADWLANEIGALRGIVRIFASGGNLQFLLKRTRPDA